MANGIKTNKNELYNSRIINTYIKFLKSRYGHVNIDELLAYAGMEAYQVEDEGHWFSQWQIDRFYEKIEQLTGNKNIAREAGRYAASSDAIGVMLQYIQGLVDLAKAYEMVGKFAPKFTRSSVYESRRIGDNKVEITVTPKEGVSEKPFQCQNRIGYFESIAIIFNNNIPDIQHDECIFKGGKVCHYTITWKNSEAATLKKIAFFSAALFMIIAPASYAVNPWAFSTGFYVLLFMLVFTGALAYSDFLEKKELRTALGSFKNTSDKLVDQIDIQYNNALIIQEIGYVISKQTGIDKLLLNIIRILEKRLDFDRGMILLANSDKTELAFRAGFGYTKEQSEILNGVRFHLRKTSSGVFSASFFEQEPFLINDAEEIKFLLSQHSREFMEQMNVKSFICCPIVYENESIGVLALDNITVRRHFLQSEVNMLMGIAPQIAVSIHNALETEAKEKQFKSVIQLLAASIDARDSLTAGHSIKVTEYAVGICRQMGKSRDFTEMLRVAALLHDYGKIGVSDSVLKKEGRLTHDEYEEIKTHAIKTKEILEQIKFEGIYAGVPEVAAYHHEKLDGSGYPLGLKGDEIPLGARIIAVADFFEAVTSKRHYREPMRVSDGFALLREQSEIHYDPEVIEAFFRYYTKTYSAV